MRILITGHTGFKGSWLALMLKEFGHEVHGIALNPLKNGIFEQSNVVTVCKSDYRIDIRDKESLNKAFIDVQPEIVLHLAAQPLVLTSYNQVFDTYSTNVSGTLNVLDSSTLSKSLKGILVVTTDKVYRNNEEQNAFSEDDPLGGQDPYSSSRALADLLTQEWASQNSNVPVGIARAGNVIGGGDVSPNRLIPDLVKALEEKISPSIRSPKSVRPWQHVMDCLSGYIALMDYVAKGDSGIFNFGPEDGDFHTVEEVANHVVKSYGGPNWTQAQSVGGKESKFLTLNSHKANSILNWRNKWTFEESLNLTIEWQKASFAKEDMYQFSLKQVKAHLNS